MSLTLEQVQAKSSAKISGLQPWVLAAAKLLIERCYNRGVPIVITQGLRTYAEQDALYAQGRTKPGSIVTNAKGGYSNHNFGMAIDFGLLTNDGWSVSWDTKLDGDRDGKADWSEVVEEAKRIGFAWGGDWTSFKDLPHFEMVCGLTTSQLRAGRKPTAAQTEAIYKNIHALKEEKNVKKDVMVTVKFNGKEIQNGVLEDGVTYLPVRAVAEALGLTVGWDQANKVVTLTKEGE